MQTSVIGPGLWNREQVADWLGVSAKTVDRLRRRDAGLAACVRKIAKRVMYSPAELAKWVEEQKRGSRSRRR